MSPRQPVVSGERLIKALRKEGWEVVRILRDADLSAEDLRALLDH